MKFRVTFEIDEDMAQEYFAKEVREAIERGEPTFDRLDGSGVQALQAQYFLTNTIVPKYGDIVEIAKVYR